MSTKISNEVHFPTFQPPEHHHWNFTPFVFAVLGLCSGPLQTPPYNPSDGQHDCLVVRNWDSSHIGKCESRDLHVYVGAGLVSLAFAKSDPENRSQRRHDLPVLFFCRSVCVAHFTKLLVTSLALPPVVFRPLLPCIAQAHRWSTDRDWNWDCDSPWCDQPAGVHRSHVSPLTVFLCQDDLSHAATSWNASQEAALNETNFSHPLHDRKTLSHCQPSPGTCGMTDNDSLFVADSRE